MLVRLIVNFLGALRNLSIYFDSSSHFHTTLTFNTGYASTLDVATAATYPAGTWYFIAAAISLNSTHFIVPKICASSQRSCTQETLTNGIVDSNYNHAPENVNLIIGNCANATGSPICPYATYSVRFYNVLSDCPTAGSNCASTDTPQLNPNLLFYMPLISNEYIGAWLGTSTFLTATPTAFNSYPINPEVQFRYTEQSCPQASYYNGYTCDPIPNLLKTARGQTQFLFAPISLANTDEWTIEGWVITVQATDNNQASLFGVGSNVAFYDVRYQNTNLFSIAARTNTSIVTSSTVTISPFNSNWHFVSLVCRINSPVTDFLNKLSVWQDINQSPAQISINTTMIPSTVSTPLSFLTIGGNFYDPTLNHSLLYVKHIRLWREALNESSLIIYARNSLLNPQNIPSLLIYFDFSSSNSSFINNLAQQPPFDIRLTTYLNTTVNTNFYAPPYLVSMYTIPSIASPKEIFTCPITFRYDRSASLCIRSEDMFQDSMQTLTIYDQSNIQVPILGLSSYYSDDWTFELWIKVIKCSTNTITFITSDLSTGLFVKFIGGQNQIFVTAPAYTTNTYITLTGIQGVSMNNWLHLELIANAFTSNFAACISQNCLSTTAQVNKNICTNYLTLGNSNTSASMILSLRELRLWSIPRSTMDLFNNFHK